MELLTALACAMGLLLVVGFVYVAAYFATAPTPAVVGEITSLVIYPLKSAKGIQVKSVLLNERGFAFDRQWMVVDERGNFLSQRRAPRLALVRVELPASEDDALVLSAPGALPITVPTVRKSKDPRKVRCWDDHVPSVDQGDEAAKWFENVLGVEGCRLVRMADDAERQVSRKYAHKGSLTALSDGFPVLLANDSSLSDLNARLTERSHKAIPMDRFRPNLIVGASAAGGAAGGVSSGPEPWAEDKWSSIHVVGGPAESAVEFGVVKPCARCKMPTINQQTGVPDRRGSSDPVVASEPKDIAPEEMDEGGGPAAEAEPTATLKTFRTGQILGYKKPGWSGDVFFGQNVLFRPSAVGRVLRVGDAVVATPRRPAGWFARGVRGVDYW